MESCAWRPEPGSFCLLRPQPSCSGALLNRVANPFPLMSAFHFFYTCAIVLSAAAGLIGLIAGVMLMNGGGSSRPLAILAAILSVSNFPVGTTLGVYTLVVLIR